jgi:cyanamide hydratase family protein with HD domain
MTSTPKTFDAFVPSNFLELFDLAKIRPDYISFDALRAVPLDDAHVAATTYTEKHLPNSAFAHSLRTYYFALAILHNGFPSETPGTPQITFEELQKRLYYACVMHDLGWTTHPGPDGVDHPAHAMSFELFGGIMAYDCLHAVDPSLNAHQVGDIVQSIMLHTTEYSVGKSSAVGTLLVLGSSFDVMGYDAFGPGTFNYVHRKTVQEIEKTYPRGTLFSDVNDLIGIKEFDAKPNCIMGHFRGGVRAPHSSLAYLLIVNCSANF